MNGVICLSLQTMQPIEPPRACVLCLGNFDGVHLAHRALMNTALKLREHRSPDAACGVFCFDPPSSDYFSKNPPAHLTTLSQKLRRFADEGMELAFVASFEALRDLTPERFLTEILRDFCHCVGGVCGFNHHFGRGGKGTPSLIREILDIPVEVQDPILYEDETVSSSRIRACLQDGRVEEATTLLTLPYSVCSTVLHGKALGRKWGFPTLNQAFPAGALIPRHGVYVTDCTLPNGKKLRGITNVGSRPTVDQAASVNCETHLLDFDGSLYGEEITVEFLHFVRPEMRFDSQDALKEQIARDLQTAKEY